MDIARLLTHDDNDDEFVAVATVPPATRSVARTVGRGKRRPTPTETLRAQVEAYEYVVANLPFALRDMDDDGGVTSDDSETTPASTAATTRIRDFLRRTITLHTQARMELVKRAELLRLLKRHYQRSASLRQLTTGLVVDDWHWMCERWRALSRENYTPFSETRCYELVQETLTAIESYKPPVGRAATSFSSFGWRDVHVLDADRRYVHFATRKTLQRANLGSLVDETWSIYSDGLHRQYNVGEHCRFFDQILQRISHDILIIQTIEAYPVVPTMTHTISIVFRVQTETGYLICARSVPSPTLQRMMRADGLSLSGNFYWTTFSTEERDVQSEEDAIDTAVVGCIGSDDRAYAERWATEIVLSLVRAEMKLMDTRLVSLTSD